jgi:hypothetical protein
MVSTMPPNNRLQPTPLGISFSGAAEASVTPDSELRVPTD